MKRDFANMKWRIFLWINLLWILGTLSLGYIAYTSEAPTGSTKLIESIKIIFLSFGGLGVILPTYLNALSALEQVKVQKIENTYHIIEKWDDPLLFEARTFTYGLKAQKGKLSDEDLIAKIKGDEKLRQSVALVMNYFDKIRISIRTNRVDVQILRDAIGDVFVDIYRRLLPYVESYGNDHKKDWDAIHDLLK